APPKSPTFGAEYGLLLSGLRTSKAQGVTASLLTDIAKRPVHRSPRDARSNACCDDDQPDSVTHPVLLRCWNEFLRRHSLALLLRCACISFFSSSGVSFGLSIDSVILLILPVNLKGT